MKLEIIFVMILVFTTFFTTFTVDANPSVSFTTTSTENKTVLSPNLNSDVTHYKWTIIGKKGGYNSETEWIPYADRGNHISMLGTGDYFITITGRNADTELVAKFTNRVKVTVKEDYVRPSKEIIEEDIGSRIINSLPEPFRTFLSERSGVELLFIILLPLLFLGIITRRKKAKKYIKLERLYDK